MFFKNHNQSRFLYNLDFEILKHWYNLQRAAEGKSAFYVPSSGQHEKILAEQERLESMRHGITVLANIWQVKPKAGREIPLKTRGILIRQAYTAATTSLTAHKVGPGDFESYTPEDIAGLENLLHYLDAKVCLMGSVGEECPEYASLSEEIGYTYRIDM